MLRYSCFEFIAFNLEKIGQPEGDNPTIYGISKKWHPKEFKEMQKAIESDNPVTIQKTINEVYEGIYEKSVASKFSRFYPLNFNVFDMAFNFGDDDAVWCWQKTFNEIVNPIHHIEVDGIYGSETSYSIDFLQSKNEEDYRIYNNFYALERIKRYIEKSPKKWRCGLVNRVIKLQEWILLSEKS